MLKASLAGLAALVVTAASFASPAIAQDIDTRAAAFVAQGDFGYSRVENIGQTFAAPSGAGAVTGFSFRTDSVPATTTFRGVLMAWDHGAARPVGPVLYESGDVTTTGPTVQDVAFTIPGGAAITPGQAYVIFATTVNSAGTGSGAIRTAPNATYADGYYVSLDAPTQADWTGSMWSPISADVGVTVTFAPLPAPVPTLSEWAMILLGLTLAGSAAVVIQRRPMAA